jgi:GT2 family glycosyltransferase
VGTIYRAGSDRIIEQAGGLFNNVGNYWGRGYTEHDLGQYEAPWEVAGVTACAMMIRRETLAGAELFDSDLFLYGEELDLTIRRAERGSKSATTLPRSLAYRHGFAGKSAHRQRLFQQFHAPSNMDTLFEPG